MRPVSPDWMGWAQCKGTEARVLLAGSSNLKAHPNRKEKRRRQKAKMAWNGREEPGRKQTAKTKNPNPFKSYATKDVALILECTLAPHSGTLGFPNSWVLRGG